MTMRRGRLLGLIGLGFLILEVMVVALAPILAPYEPTHVFYGAILSPPSAHHLLGTDNLGQDVLSQLIWGGRTSLLVGGAASLFSGVLGVGVGLLSANRVTDFWLMRLVDTIMAFPPILLALAIIGAVGSNLDNEILVISIGFFPYTARVVRSEVLRLRELAYVEAAHAIGASPLRILLRHIAPNAMPAIIVQMIYTFARAIVLDAALSYLGLGVPPPTPSWGIMLADAQPFLSMAWWFWLPPSLAIMGTTIGLSLVANSFADQKRVRRKRKQSEPVMGEQLPVKTSAS